MCLVNKRLEHIPRKIESTFDKFFITFEDSIFMLDAHNIIVTCRGERCEELSPIDIAQPWQARNLPPHTLRKHSVVIKACAVNVQVLGVNMENLAGKLAHHAFI